MLQGEIEGKGRKRFSKAGVVIGRLEVQRQEKCKSPPVANANNTIVTFFPAAEHIEQKQCEDCVLFCFCFVLISYNWHRIRHMADYLSN